MWEPVAGLGLTAVLQDISLAPCDREAGAYLYQTEEGETLLQSIRPSHDGARDMLVFDRDGRQYDQFTATAARVTGEWRIYGMVGYIELSFAKYVVVITRREQVACHKALPIWTIRRVEVIPVARALNLVLEEEEEERGCREAVTSIFTSGHLYYSADVDLTQSLQHHQLGERTWPRGDLGTFYRNMATGYIWNYQLLEPFLGETRYLPFVFPCVCGAVVSRTLQLRQYRAQLLLLSRVCRLGFGYERRGLHPDTGHAAGQMETELLVHHEQHLLSFTLLRGSLPLLWGQEFTRPFAPHPQVDGCRAGTNESFLALRRHLKDLRTTYGMPTTLLDLLNEGRTHLELSQALRRAISRLDEEDGLGYLHHPFTEGRSLLQALQGTSRTPTLLDAAGQSVRHLLAAQGFCRRFLDHQTQQERQSSIQRGVFRYVDRRVIAVHGRAPYWRAIELLMFIPLLTRMHAPSINALDVVDEVDVAAYGIARLAAVTMLEDLHLLERRAGPHRSVECALSSMFTANADAISQILMGSDSLATAAISTSGRWAAPWWRWRETRILVTRAYITIFQRALRQDNLAAFMRNYAPSPDAVSTPARPVALATQRGESDAAEGPYAALLFARLLRRRISLSESARAWYVSYFILLRKLLAPHVVRSPWQFFCACLWLALYWLYTSWLRVEHKHIIRTSLSTTDLSDLPPLSSRRRLPLPMTSIERQLSALGSTRATAARGRSKGATGSAGGLRSVGNFSYVNMRELHHMSAQLGRANGMTAAAPGALATLSPRQRHEV